MNSSERTPRSRKLTRRAGLDYMSPDIRERTEARFGAPRGTPARSCASRLAIARSISASVAPTATRSDPAADEVEVVRQEQRDARRRRSGRAAARRAPAISAGVPTAISMPGPSPAASLKSTTAWTAALASATCCDDPQHALRHGRGAPIRRSGCGSDRRRPRRD